MKYPSSRAIHASIRKDFLKRRRELVFITDNARDRGVYCWHLECANFIVKGGQCPQHPPHVKRLLSEVKELVFNTHTFAFEVELLAGVFVIWRVAYSVRDRYDCPTKLDSLEAHLESFTETADQLMALSGLTKSDQADFDLEGYSARHVSAPSIYTGEWEVKEGNVGVTDNTDYECTNHHYTIWTPVPRVIYLLNACADAIERYLDENF